MFTPQALAQLVVDEDVSGLCRAPGIGKKKAQQIFIELKYKLKLDEAAPGGGLGLDDSAVSAFRDALSGLLNLGYAEEEARPALDQAFKAEPDLETAQALRQALKIMAKRS